MNHLHSELGQEFESPAIVDEVVSGTTYVGYARPGTTATSEEAFGIKKITVVAGITTIEWANGSRAKDQIWDDRAILTYSMIA